MMFARWLIVATVCLIINFTALVHADERPMRIVSLHLCADQYLMYLADPEQIASLGPRADDPRISYLATSENWFRIIGPRTEDILLLEPDLVITAPFGNLQLRNFLRDEGLRVVDMGAPQSFAEVIVEVEMIAALIGQEERGAALIEEIQAARRASLGAGAGTALLYLQRRGFANGRGTLFAEMIADLEFENVLSNVDGIQRVPLELLVGLRPQAVLVALDEVATDGTVTALDQGMALLGHPSLKAGFPDAKWFALPPRETVCPGPATIALYRRLVDIAAELDGGS